MLFPATEIPIPFNLTSMLLFSTTQLSETDIPEPVVIIFAFIMVLFLTREFAATEMAFCPPTSAPTLL